MVDLEPGDYLYQANSELFLVCIENNEHSIDFAAHGWRTIDKERLSDYLDADKPVMHTEEQVKEIIEEVDDPKAMEKLNWLEGIFEKYKHGEINEQSSHSEFSLDDT
jgi:hypothetical protein